MNVPVKLQGRRIVGGTAEFVTPFGGWSADPADALEVTLEGDPTVGQQAAAERAVVAFLGGYRPQAELTATVRELYAAVAEQCDELAEPGADPEAERERVYLLLDSKLKEAFIRARTMAERAEWVGRWNACFIRGPEAWRKLDSVTADDAAIFALRTAYEEATAEIRVGKARSSGR